MAFDLIACIILLHENTTEMFEVYFHHVVGVVGFTCVFLAESFPMVIGATNMMVELSNNFLHMNYILTYHGHKDNPLYLANGVIFLLVYFCVRVVFFPYNTYLGIWYRLNWDWSDKSFY